MVTTCSSIYFISYLLDFQQCFLKIREVWKPEFQEYINLEKRFVVWEFLLERECALSDGMSGTRHIYMCCVFLYKLCCINYVV